MINRVFQEGVFIKNECSFFFLCVIICIIGQDINNIYRILSY